ncbi:MAG: 6-bladed beta-propeller [Desulfococcaceae bacterium]
MKTVSRKRSYALAMSVSCVLFLISLPVSAFSQEEYVFERMWPTLQQPWYFNDPRGLAVDSTGSIYVLEFGNNWVQKFTSEGEFIDKFGGYGSGPGQFNSPADIATDENNNVYVLEWGGNRVQKFSSTGEFLMQWGGYVTEWGGFSYPTGIAVGKNGFVYVANTKSNQIVKFTLDGVYVQKWGSLGTGDSQFDEPSGIEVDSSGFVYVADNENHRIQKFTSDGEFVRKWGNNGSGVGEFDFPYGISIDAFGNVYVTDQQNNRIQKFTSDGAFISAWGDSGSDNGDFLSPRGIAVDSAGFVYTGERYNNRIQKFTSDGAFAAVWQSSGTANGSFSSPYAVAVDHNGDIYAADTLNDRIQKFTKEGNFLWKIDTNLKEPYGIAVDSKNQVYVTGRYNHSVQVFTPNGQFLKEWGSYGSEPEKFAYPFGIAIDSNDFVYVVDQNNFRIQKFASDGTYVTHWGQQGSTDGSFQDPYGITVGSDGNVYVADTSNNRIQKFAPDGTFLMAVGSSSGLKNPTGVAVNNDGLIYVTDRDNHRIPVFNPDGAQIQTWGEKGQDPGTFFSPASLAFDSDGRIFVCEAGNNRIQVFKTATAPPVKKSKSIIVAGGGPYPGNNLWNATQMCANFAYRALLYQGYTKDTLYYISHDYNRLDLDGNGLMDDVDADAANANLESAIKTWAADAQDLFIYMVDHGGDGTFRMREFQLLNATDLDSWMDSVQAVIPGKVVLLYDACRSGSFLPQLTPPAGKERIIVASSGPDQASVFASGGTVSFSFLFWSHIFNGESFYTSFVRASQAMELTGLQISHIDADGNGIGNETEDINLAQILKIGNETLSASDLPSIQSASPPQTLVDGETSARLYAENITDADGISRVWAVIVPPGSDTLSPGTPVTELPQVSLKDYENCGVYEENYTGFTQNGTYNILIYAKDLRDMQSLPIRTTVIQNNARIMGDISGTDNLTLADVVIALKVLAGADTSGLIRADYAASKVDVNGDDTVGMEEAVYILRKVAGL